jgi:uncharacterized protein YeeX (DUF496 family)
LDLKAVVALSDEIFALEDKLDKACLLIQELNDKYFLKYDMEKEENKKWIWWEFSRYKIYADMIDDYVFEAKEVIDKLRKIEERYYDEKKKLKVVETEQETA